MSEFQYALIFPFLPFLILLILEAMLPEDDDDDRDGGILQPAYLRR
jgi:hypothetical protein